MLSYELAKALQDAGFPQSGSGTRVARPDVIVARRHDFAYVPTLEELIEACGDEIRGMTRDDDGKWAAHGGVVLKEICTLGTTATEAVARLWLALNTKV